MADAEVLFGECNLDVVVPDTVIPFPEENADVDDWLKQARQSGERKQAFFGELEILLACPCLTSNAVTSLHSNSTTHKMKSLCYSS